MSQLAAEPLVLLPVNQEIVDLIKKVPLQKLKTELEKAQEHLACLANAEKRGAKQKGRAKKECQDTLDDRTKHEETLLEKKIKESLYSQVVSSKSRGFPYGFEGQEQFKHDSKQLLQRIRDGVEVGSHSQIDKGAISARFAGSSVSGLSYLERSESRGRVTEHLRKVFHEGSDFDIAVYLPKKSYEWVYDQFNKAMKAANRVKGTKVCNWRTDCDGVDGPFPLGVSKDGNTNTSRNCTDAKVAERILKDLGIFDSLASLATLRSRDVNLVFKQAGQPDCDYEEPVVERAAGGGGARVESKSKPPTILVHESS